MQLISPGLPLAAASATPPHPRFSEFLQREEIHHLASFIFIVLVGSQLAHIIATWIASKAVAEEDDATLVNATKVWILNLLIAVGAVTALVIGVPLAMHAGHQGELWHVLAVVGGIALLWLILALLIPRKIYGISSLGAWGLVLLTGLINGGVTTGFEAILIPAMHLEKDIAKLQGTFGKTKEEQQHFTNRLLGVESPDEIDRLLDDALYPIGPQPALADQEAMVRTLQQKLTARQHNLNGNDSHAIDVYQTQVRRYLQFRNQVLANRNKT